MRYLPLCAISSWADVLASRKSPLISETSSTPTLSLPAQNKIKIRVCGHARLFSTLTVDACEQDCRREQLNCIPARSESCSRAGERKSQHTGKLPKEKSHFKRQGLPHRSVVFVPISAS